MIKTIISLFITLYLSSALYASQSVITESDGYACMGEDKSRKQTEQATLSDAKRKAIEKVSTYIKSETHVKDFELEKDLVSAYANADVKVVAEMEKLWYKDATMGDCYRVKLKVEVLPDEKKMEETAKSPDDPSLPLNIKVWTDKKEYKGKDRIKIYVKGNKPFYARIMYKDAGGSIVQLLPNPYREDNYFNGGVIYELPSGNDRFELEVTAPFGKEGIVVYGSTAPLGDIDVAPAGGVYAIKTDSANIGVATRGVKLVKSTGKTDNAEFSESEAVLTTGR